MSILYMLGKYFTNQLVVPGIDIVQEGFDERGIFHCCCFYNVIIQKHLNLIKG